MDESVLARRLLIGEGLLASFLLPSWWSGHALAAGHHRHPARPAARPKHPHGARRRTVVLDPGHGGKDPGAIGYSGTYEKKIALATAHELKRQLERTGRYRVSMTRETDVFVRLERRVELAQARGAELFVSMHADSVGDHSVRGASVYTLAATASDAQTARLAERENSADRFGDSHFRAVSPAVAQILASLVRRETRIDSAHLAHDLVGQLDRDLPMLLNPARHAAFVVLKSAAIPSVLVEMGFMSNPKDEAALRRPQHREVIAAAMHRAVNAYFASADRLSRMVG